MSTSNGNGNGNHAGGVLTYAEVRRWARLLQIFTPSDLADVLRVDLEAARRMSYALIFHDVVRDSGGEAEGVDGPEPILEYVPLPTRIYPRNKRTPPEIEAVLQMGGFEILSPRGTPVRIRTERQMRRSLSTPGARQVHRNRERNYERMMEKQRQRAEEQQSKGPALPKWLRRKKKSTPTGVV